SAPAEICRLTLEGRTRMGPGGWEPRAVSRVDGTGGAITFRLSRSRETELMRVRGDATEPLPPSFYTGTNSVLGQPGRSPGPGGLAVLDGGPADRNSPAPPDPSREVTESDIWKIREQNSGAGTRSATLYFFNQYRGLQIIDVTAPDAAVLR